MHGYYMHLCDVHSVCLYCMGTLQYFFCLFNTHMCISVVNQPYITDLIYNGAKMATLGESNKHISLYSIYFKSLNFNYFSMEQDRIDQTGVWVSFVCVRACVCSICLCLHVCALGVMDTDESFCLLLTLREWRMLYHVDFAWSCLSYPAQT